jgi:LmbE family N-acetylglucosaminyl deacetylase
MNVVVIAPHPDDECLGCGGALCLHANKGDRTVAVFLTSGELGLKHLPREKAWSVRESEAAKAATILKLSALHFLRCRDWALGEDVTNAVAALLPLLKQENPHWIYLPHECEWHPDHQVAFRIVREAVKQSGISPSGARAYEIWTPLSEYDQVEDISIVMSRKLRALRAHRSQLDSFDYVRAIRGLNQYRGVIAGKCRYAEVFQTLKLAG